jgi:hypothetical protein
MNRVFIDTEFNGFNGDLLSMALVPEDETKPIFYKEIEFKGQLDPWVRENVVPHFIELSISYAGFQQQLAGYLYEIGECTIIADWPDDIRYFCQALITGPGNSIPIFHKINFVLDTKIQYESKVPHNALYDAIAIRESYKGK